MSNPRKEVRMYDLIEERKRAEEAEARVAELEADKEKLVGYGEVLGLRVRQAEARVAELEAALVVEREHWIERCARHIELIAENWRASGSDQKFYAAQYLAAEIRSLGRAQG